MARQKEGKQGRRGLVSSLIVTLVILLGVAMILYPTVSEYLCSLDYKRTIETYRQSVESIPRANLDALFTGAEAWNAELFARGGAIAALTGEESARYRGLLNPAGDGMMGYVDIPKIKAALPIYHGTEESVLQSGVGHIEGSSLPVGGENTHTLITGHSGLVSARLFTDIDQLETGDTFTLHVLGRVLTYQVESTAVMLPEGAEKQSFSAGEDRCTLITCTPYGVNTHRLLVRGVRIFVPPESEDFAEPMEATPVPMPLIIGILAVLAVIAAVTVFLVVRHRRRKAGEHEQG